MEEIKPISTQGTTASPSLAPVGASAKSGNVPPSTSAAKLVPKFGGLRGAKPRKDGLIPGSPEATEADRKRDAARKRDERATLAAQIPPAPLPSALPGSQNTAQPAFVPLGSDQASSTQPTQDFVAWTPEDLIPLCEEIIGTAELVSIAKLLERARKVQLPETFIKQIEKELPWPSISRKTLLFSLPRLASQWLNEAGVSAKNKHALVVVASGCSIAAHYRKIASQIDAAGKQFQAQQSSNAVEKL